MGLIGFKLQALQNEPSRQRDAEDIRELIRVNRHRMNMDQVWEYFVLFNRQEWPQELIEELRFEQESPGN